MNIKSKRFPKELDRRPTMKDVAVAAGVSISSVSHLINGTRYVSPEVSIKIGDAIKALNFRPNSAARVLRNGKSGLIGFVTSNLENSFYVRIAKGLEKVINSHGYDMVLMDSSESKSREIDNVRSLYMRGLEGLVIVPTTPDCSYLEELLPSDYPLVFVDRHAEPVALADTVLLANAKASKSATDYLLAKGLKEIAFIAFHFGVVGIDKTMLERIEGYKRALLEAGIPVKEEYIAATSGVPNAVTELQYSDTYWITGKLLENYPIQAIICGNDLAAIGVYSYLKDNKIQIPQQIAMITFDDSLWLKTATPTISAIAQPAEALGVLAGQRIIQRLQGTDIQPDVFRLNADLIIRESS